MAKKQTSTEQLNPPAQEDTHVQAPAETESAGSESEMNNEKSPDQLEQERLEAERLEAERLEAEKAEAARLEEEVRKAEEEAAAKDQAVTAERANTIRLLKKLSKAITGKDSGFSESKLVRDAWAIKRGAKAYPGFDTALRELTKDLK